MTKVTEDWEGFTGQSIKMGDQSWVGHPGAGSLGHSEKPWEEDTLGQEVNSSTYQMLFVLGPGMTEKKPESS